MEASQEMVALGLCQVFGSCAGSLPITASFGRSAVNSSSGVRTTWGGGGGLELFWGTSDVTQRSETYSTSVHLLLRYLGFTTPYSISVCIFVSLKELKEKF
jgi:hypothetical protein